MRSFKPEVRTGSDPKFYGNALAFATYAEALHSASDVARRWFLVTDYRAVESDEAVTHAVVDNVVVPAGAEVSTPRADRWTDGELEALRRLNAVPLAHNMIK